jgi:hypothetical protein
MVWLRFQVLWRWLWHGQSMCPRHVFFWVLLQQSFWGIRSRAFIGGPLRSGFQIFFPAKNYSASDRRGCIPAIFNLPVGNFMVAACGPTTNLRAAPAFTLPFRATRRSTSSIAAPQSNRVLPGTPRSYQGVIAASSFGKVPCSHVDSKEGKNGRDCR